MSKLTKLINNPTSFVVDMAKKRTPIVYSVWQQYRQLRLAPASAITAAHEATSRTRTFLFGFSPWKQFMVTGFPEREFFFIDKQISLEQFQADWQHLLLATHGSEVMVWGFKFPEFLSAFVAQHGIPLTYVEDGFIRSIDLGATKTPPISLTLDRRTPYFNANQPSDLEVLLESYDFLNQPDLMNRAQSLMSLLVSTGLSKYNQAKPLYQLADVYGLKEKKRILVIGQVEDDASIKYGCEKNYTNNDLVLIAAQENPDAQIFYKPHPDVLSRNRPRQSDPRDISHVCQVIQQDLPLSQALETIDHVYTITSQAGFEALQRGIKVTTLGMPFYSGWGLTDDRQSCPRRQRQLTIEQLFAGVYLLYLQFFDPITQEKTTAEQAIQRLLELRQAYFEHPMQGVAKLFLRQQYHAAVNQLTLAPYQSVADSLNRFAPVRTLRLILDSIKQIQVGGGVSTASSDSLLSIVDPRHKSVLLQARTLLVSVDPKPAKLYLQAAVLEYPASKVLLSLLYEIQVRQADFSAAIATLSQMILLEPKNSQLYLQRASNRLKNGDFSDAVDADFIKAIDLSVFDHDILYRYFSYLWEKAPVSDTLLRNIDHALEKIPFEQRKEKSYGKLLLLKASMLVETGQQATAYKLHREAKRLGAVDTNLLALRCTVRKFDAASLSASEAEVAAYQKLLHFRNRFRTLVLEAKGSVCIVGNAPNLIGTQLGAQIDQNQLVIRFNSYNTNHPYQQDYGSKTDIWVRMPFHPYVRREPSAELKLVIFTGSNRLYRSYTEWAGIVDYLNMGLPVQFFPADEFYELQKILGAPPTAGLMLCYMLYQIIGPLSPAHYCGLSFAHPQDVQSEYHYSDINARPSSRHDWKKEADFFQQLIVPTDSNIDQLKLVTEQKKNVLEPDRPVSFFTPASVGFDRVVSVSPGLLHYVLFDQSVQGISGAKTEQHLKWLNDPTTGEASPLLLSILPTERVCILGFGRSKTGQLAIRLAESLKVQYRLVEYGLITSMHLPKDKKFNFSLILDDIGIFYDTTAVSRIERILLEDTDIFALENSQRAQMLIHKIVQNNVTKYNNTFEFKLPKQEMQRRRILVIDQTAGDHSIIYGQCEHFSFDEMLQHALDQQDAEVFLKIHPETTAGTKHGNFDLSQEILATPHLHVIDRQCNIMSLIKQVDEVYVMTSGVGLEALLIGKSVRCFGVPFYAGWGLTNDMVAIRNPRRPLTLTALFAAVFFKYHVFFHPDTHQQCDIEICIDWIIQHQAAVNRVS